MIMIGDDNNLKLGKGSAFVKSQLKRLRQEDETWEADFRALPTPMMHSAAYHVGMVLSRLFGFLLAETEINQSPTDEHFDAAVKGDHRAADVDAPKAAQKAAQQAHAARRIEPQTAGGRAGKNPGFAGVCE